MDPVNVDPQMLCLMIQVELVNEPKAVYIVFDGNP